MHHVITTICDALLPVAGITGLDRRSTADMLWVQLGQREPALTARPPQRLVGEYALHVMWPAERRALSGIVGHCRALSGIVGHCRGRERPVRGRRSGPTGGKVSFDGVKLGRRLLMSVSATGSTRTLPPQFASLVSKSFGAATSYQPLRRSSPSKCSRTNPHVSTAIRSSGALAASARHRALHLLHSREIGDEDLALARDGTSRCGRRRM